MSESDRFRFDLARARSLLIEVDAESSSAFAHGPARAQWHRRRCLEAAALGAQARLLDDGYHVALDGDLRPVWQRLAVLAPRYGEWAAHFYRVGTASGLTQRQLDDLLRDVGLFLDSIDDELRARHRAAPRARVASNAHPSARRSPVQQLSSAARE